MVSDCYQAKCSGAFPDIDEEEFYNLFRCAPDYEEEGREQGWEECDSCLLAQFVLVEPLPEKSEYDEAAHEINGRKVLVIEESMADSWEDLAEEQGFADDARDNAQEVLEHWIVTPWAARRLAELGEATGELFDFHIWGRTCSGQAILLDGVWGSLAASMEILEGQRNEWKA